MKRKWTVLLAIIFGVFLTSCGNTNPGREIINSSGQVTDSKVVESTEEQQLSTSDPTVNVTANFMPAKEGPAYVCGTAKDDYYVNEEDFIEQNPPAYTATLGYVFITSPGYDALKKSLADDISISYTQREQISQDVQDSFKTEDFDREGMQLPWSYESRRTVYRADSKLFGVVNFTMEDMGGPHPNHASYTFNYDTATGKRLSLEDVVTDSTALKDIIISKMEQIADADTGLYDGWKETVDTQLRDGTINWLYYPDSICIYFNPYDVAPYAEGEISIDITYEEYPALFSSNYLGYMDEKDAVGTEIIDVTPYTAKAYRDIVMPLFHKIGQIGYDETLQFVQKFNYEYVSNSPDEAETDGELKIYDKDSSDFLYLLMGYGENGASVLSEIWYYHGGHRALFVLKQDTGAIETRLQDDTLYESIYMDSLEDVTAALFLGVEQ